MAAICKCSNGHVFSSRIEEDDPSTNCLIVEDQECPECKADFEVIDIEYESDFED